MAFWGDYHTHTVFSHGKSSIEENVLRAISLGFKEIAITDHGFKHMTFNVRRSDWGYIMQEAAMVKEKYPQINVYLGLETNFNSTLGTVDIEERDMDVLELLVCGYHKFVRPDRFSDIFTFYLPNFFADTFGFSSAKLIASNTNAYIKAIERYELDIISHPCYSLELDMNEVSKAAAHYGTYLELNGKRIRMSDAQIEQCMANGGEFICNSDAHSLGRVGDMSLPLRTIERLNIPFESIANWDKLPNFRSRGARKIRERL